MYIADVLKKQNIKASFFLTGRFYRKKDFQKVINRLKMDGHYLGAHSDQHLLYCDWKNRELLVSRSTFESDLSNNYKAMELFGIKKVDAKYFLPPYEWYNDSISKWTNEMGLQLINYSPGTLSHADYTTPEDPNYRSSETIFRSVTDFEKKSPSGLKGFILLLHIGTHPGRTDKFYYQLDSLVSTLKSKGYAFVKIDKLLR